MLKSVPHSSSEIPIVNIEFNCLLLYEQKGRKQSSHQGKLEMEDELTLLILGEQPTAKKHQHKHGGTSQQLDTPITKDSKIQWP